MTETDDYRSQGYTPLKGLYPTEVLHAFHNQMQVDLQAAGRPIQSFTASGPLLRHQAIEVYALQYAPMLTFLWGLTPRIALATGCDLLPTYAYFRAYRQDDICRVHLDRHACEHSLSLTVAYGDDKPWALSVETERTDVPSHTVSDDFGGSSYGSVAMLPGDGVLYQGIHHRHGRLEPNPNTWSAHLFLHWLDKNGPYRDQAFDRPMRERVAQGQ